MTSVDAFVILGIVSCFAEYNYHDNVEMQVAGEDMGDHVSPSHSVPCSLYDS